MKILKIRSMMSKIILKNYCNSAGMDFINNSDIDGSYLNRAKLHLNRKGTATLEKNLCRFVRSLLVD